MYQIVQKQLPNLQQAMTQRQFGLLISKNGDYFGHQQQRKIGNEPARGRSLFVLKEYARDSFKEKVNAFKYHMQAAKGEWINIGYVRKSPGNEPIETRERLVQGMASRLQNQVFCRKMFVFDGTPASQPIMMRD
ncbi:hypothetical protein RMCBS344292_13685 [Rhizopus microsporus]|nr:hypothetical protein RMCBS344292_13685 [Rhizopus microsporus]